MEQYTYQPLDESEFEVRFFILLPGERQDPIRGYLITAVLHPETGEIPDYEALSYAWGSPDNPASIAVADASPSNGSNLFEPVSKEQMPGKFRSIAITQNLAIALPYLRHKDQPRTLWIDAICVNQRDLAERSRQVIRMANVFSHAKRTVAWIGNDLRAEPALDFLLDVVSRIEATNLSPPSLDARGIPSSLLRLRLSIDTTTLDSLIVLFEMPWFYRLWVVQEIQLANSAHSILMLGERSIHWKHFDVLMSLLAKVKILRYDGNLHRERQRLEKCLRHLYLFTRNLVNMPLIRLLDTTKNAQCSEPRDRAYGLLSLCVTGALPLRPDYTATPMDVYRQMTEGYILQHWTLDILSYCELSPHRNQGPSWVLDLSISRTSESIYRNLITVPTSTQPTVRFEGDILRAQGLQVAVIEKLTGRFHNHAPKRDVLRQLGELLTREQLEGQYPGRGNMIDAVVGTLDVGSSARRDGLRRRQGTADHLRTLIEDMSRYWKSWDLDMDAYHLSDDIKSKLLTDRRLFYPAEGYLGCCTHFAQELDVVVFLCGCSTPLILRPRRGGQYSIVGEAYCHGLVDGEPYLGQLPKDIVRVFDKDTQMPLFVDSQTGATKLEDPRLGPLGGKWKRLGGYRSRGTQRFVDLETGKKYRARHFDPRMTAEELNKRGVELQSFDIV